MICFSPFGLGHTLGKVLATRPQQGTKKLSKNSQQLQREIETMDGVSANEMDIVGINASGEAIQQFHRYPHRLAKEPMLSRMFNVR